MLVRRFVLYSAGNVLTSFIIFDSKIDPGIIRLFRSWFRMLFPNEPLNWKFRSKFPYVNVLLNAPVRNGCGFPAEIGFPADTAA
ncbi:hypothetical protein D9M68_989410 [compost metagenome]